MPLKNFNMENNKELEAYLQQLKAMGMNDTMIEMYRQQYIQSMDMVNQMQQNMNFGQANAEDQMNAFMGAMGIQDGITMSEKTNLTLPQQWAIACGADLAYLNDHPLNTLGTDEDKNDIRTQLSEWWDVDGKDELLDTIAYLENGGHRERFFIVNNALQMKSTAEAKKFLNENIEDYDTAMEWFHNMRNAYEQFTADGLLPANPDFPNMMAWDFVRIINLCRNGFDAKYLTEKEALEIIMKTARTIQPCFNSWKELSVSYQFGRYVWGGDDQYEILKDEMNDLLTDPKSPWVVLDWNMKLQ